MEYPQSVQTSALNDRILFIKLSGFVPVTSRNTLSVSMMTSFNGMLTVILQAVFLFEQELYTT